MATLFDDLFPPRPPEPYSAYAPIQRRRRATPEPRASYDAAEVARIAVQLARVAASVPWGRVQDDLWDSQTGFVYRVRSAAGVRARAEALARARGADPTDLVHYALRRWYCFWGARVAELLFLRHPGVEPGPPRHHEVDFTIDGQPFDLKTSEVPRRFHGSVEDLSRDPAKLAPFLYQHQSREGRYHTANRLFLLLCDPREPDEAWRLRGDVAALRQAIDRFMDGGRRFLELRVPAYDGSERSVKTAVIAVVPTRPVDAPRQLRMELGSRPAPRPARPAEPKVLAPRLF